MLQHWLTISNQYVEHVENIKDNVYCQLGTQNPLHFLFMHNCLCKHMEKQVLHSPLLLPSL